MQTLLWGPCYLRGADIVMVMGLSWDTPLSYSNRLWVVGVMIVFIPQGGYFMVFFRLLICTVYAIAMVMAAITIANAAA